MIFSSCSSYWETQEEYLLPASSNIKRIKTKVIGITTYNYYDILGEISGANLLNFPKNAMAGRGWIMKKWHTASTQEIENLNAFFTEEKSDQETASKIIETIKDGKNYVIAYAHDNGKPSLMENDYMIYNWMEFYYLDMRHKKLIHISYGKF